MKQIVKLVFISIIAFCLFGEARADDGTITLYYNGAKMILVDENNEIQDCVSINDQVYVPIRFFIESIGGDYEFDSLSSTAYVTLSKNNAEKSASKKRIDITAENFRDYFIVTSSYTKPKQESEHNRYAYTKWSTELKLSIVAKYPFEINNVQFNVRIRLEIDGDTAYINCKGTIMQTGSSVERSQFTFEKQPYFTPTIWGFDVSSIEDASGYILVDNDFALE